MKQVAAALLLILPILVCLVGATRDIGTWTLRNDLYAKESGSHRVTILLKHTNLDRLEKTVWAVSDPDSPSYGNYLTIDQLTELISPSPEAIKTVYAWLYSHGLYDSQLAISKNRDAIEVTASREIIARMFDIKFQVFEAPNGKFIIRSLEAHQIPKEVAPYVDLVRGLSDFPPVKGRITDDLYAIDSPTKQRRSPADVVPQFVRAVARGGTNQISIDFNPECTEQANGTYTCSSTVPQDIAYFNVTVTPSAVYGNPMNYEVRFNPNACSVVNNVAQCSITVGGSLYNAVNISIEVVTNDNTVSEPTYYQFPVLSTPAILPQNIWAQYSIPAGTYVTNLTATQCVVEFEQQYYSPSDLQLFFRRMGLPTDTPVYTIGPNYANNPGGEANLDIQYIMGVAPGSPTTFWSIAANSTVEIDDILAWALQIANTPNPPLVNSLSYGMTEGNVDKYLGQGYLARSDIEFQKLAARGITVIIACGDAGAGDLGPPPMSAQDCNVLHADWPSQSPYVTAVGSTIITPVAEPICYMPPNQGGVNCDNGPLGEIVVGMDQGLFWTTGGGFSNITGTAPYQFNYVQNYLVNNAGRLPAPGTFNPRGRAYPDVSTVGHNLMVALNGTFIPVDGTSASAPIFAGVVTLLNNARLNAGKAPLGFLNPMLYKAKAVDSSTFYDVTVGTNRCGTIDFQPYCCERGFVAAQGWDAASGLGTPNYQSLKNYVLSLQ